MSEPTLEPAGPVLGPSSSSFTARRLALSSGLSDSFSSMANVVPEATLCLSKLGSLTELSDDETCVLVSSVGVFALAPEASGGLESPAEGLAMT